MSTAQAIDPLEEAVRQRLAARRAPAADPLEQAVAARLRMRRESPDTFAPPVNTEPPMVGLPAQGSAPVDGVAMVDQQAAAAHEQAAHDKALPWPVKAAGVVGGAVLGGAQRLEEGWRGFANTAADVATGRTPLDAAVLGGAPQPPPSDPAILPQVIASAAGVPAAGIPENIQRMQEVGAQADPVTRFVGGLAAMPFDALTPEGIAALAITHAPAGALMRATYTRAALGAVADRLGPGVAKATESALSGAAGLGGFSAVQTGLGGSTPEQAAESGLHGAAAGALFGLGGAAMGAGAGRFAKAAEARRAASDTQFREAGQVISDAKEAAPAEQYGVQRTVQMDSPGQVPQAFRDPPANSMADPVPARIREDTPGKQVIGQDRLQSPDQSGEVPGAVTPELPATQNAPEVPKTEAIPEIGVAKEPVPLDVVSTLSKIEATDYDPTITGLRKSMTAAERKIMGLDGLDSPERRTHEQGLKEAHDTGLMKPEKTQELIDAMNKEPWAASPAEKMAMLSHKVRLKNEALKLEGELTTIKGEDPASVADGQFKLAELHRIEQEIDWTDHAYAAAGTASGRSLQAHAAAMNEAMDLVTVKARARAEKGTTLSPKETAEFQALHKQFEEVSKRATEAEAKLAEQQAETAIVRHKGGLRRKNPVVQKAEFDGLLKRARELLDMGCR